MTTAQTATRDTATRDATSRAVVSADSGPLGSAHGKTVIADTVVSKIAGLAAREVNGVHALGGGASRAVGALRERIPGATVNHSQGVSVEVGAKEAAVDIDIVAEYGVSIADLASGIRRNVIAAIERMTGLTVVEVDITVHDIHVAGDDPDEDPAGKLTRVE
ncbi:stress protein, Gls24 family [Mycobacterium sp. 852013-51886_SCH5428379]|uniref:Asp23/Gls24 family envelope stress response protein n=1 Tax=Mycobacterium sp. 852013-51886_SCH5428379 TaxID=1834111 RepID=UPI00080186A1|nr:Asp23/Gls24 family envelope stress response protein [Mycobacterium sp. 852013-51886_SCH5428379]OBB58297.1 stress protein, Gls24 family [Mycobacterium sp. 852013-51886_SCH5428379]